MNNLIILDDFGLQPMKTNTWLDLLQVLEERFERQSKNIASQFFISKWYDYIGNLTLTVRLVASVKKMS